MPTNRFGDHSSSGHLSRILDDKTPQLGGMLDGNGFTFNGAVAFEAKAGEALSKGNAVYVSGVSGNKPVVMKADADDAAKMPAFGIAETDASLNANVNVVTFGTVYEIDTSAYLAGDELYVSTTAGELTPTKPTGATAKLQNIGKVIRSHASAGSIKVGGAGRTNAVPNLDDGTVFIGDVNNQAEQRALVLADISDYTAPTETDPVYTASSWYTTTNNSSNWDTAYGWGNHASAGYLTSFTETDPVFTASAASGITATNISNWNTAYGWGNHASAGYTSTTGPFYHYSSLGSAAPGTSQTARFGRSSAQYMTFHGTSAGNVLTSVSAASNPKPNMYFAISQDGGSTSGQVFTLNGSSGTIFHTGNFTDNSTNWNTAYGWGNHATQNYAVTTGDTFTGKLTITNANYDNHLELNRSSEQWRFSPSTNGSLDIRRISGTGDAIVDLPKTIVTDSLGATTISGAGLTTNRSTAYIATASAGQQLRFQSDVVTVYDQGNTTNRFQVSSSGISTPGSVSASVAYIASGTNSSRVYLDCAADSIYDVRLSCEYDYDGWFQVQDGGGVTRFSVGRDNHAYVGGAGTAGNKLWDEGDFTSTSISNWNTAYGWGDHASAGYGYFDHFRYTGNGYYSSTTTSALVAEAFSDGSLKSGLTAHKTGWSYAGNGNLTDAGRLTELAGTSWLWWTDNTSDTSYGNYTALCIAPTTGGSAGKAFIYNNQGSGYSPGWREIWTSTSDGSGSGLDADTVDGVDSSRILFGVNSSGTYNSNPNATAKSGFYDIYGTANNAPTNTWYSWIHMRHTNTASYWGHQIAGSFYSTGDIYNRNVNNGTYGAWTKIWNASNDGSGSGLDADTLDGIDSGGFLRSNATDYLTGRIYTREYLIAETGYRNRGIVGTYDSTKTQQIWAMGTSYLSNAAGTNFGSLYGLAYKHTNNSTGGTMAGGHQVVWCQAGTAYAALGSNIWTSGNVTAYSDIRVKTNLEVIPDALYKVCKLNGYTFDRTDVKYDDHGMPTVPIRQTGVVAQEVLEVLPEAVTGDEESHYNVAYGNMVGLLIEAIKEQQAQIEELKEKLK